MHSVWGGGARWGGARSTGRQRVCQAREPGSCAVNTNIKNITAAYITNSQYIYIYMYIYNNPLCTYALALPRPMSSPRMPPAGAVAPPQHNTTQHTQSATSHKNVLNLTRSQCHNITQGKRGPCTYEVQSTGGPLQLMCRGVQHRQGQHQGRHCTGDGHRISVQVGGWGGEGGGGGEAEMGPGASPFLLHCRLHSHLTPST